MSYTGQILSFLPTAPAPFAAPIFPKPFSPPLRNYHSAK